MSEPAAGWRRRLRDDAWGALVIARRELWANILSPRSLVMVLLLSLIMLLAATGFAGFAARQDQGRTESYLTHVIAADEDAVLNDLVVFAYYDDTFEPVPGRNVSLGGEERADQAYWCATDAHGLAVLRNLTVAYHFLEVELRTSDSPLTTGMGVGYSDDPAAGAVYVPGTVLGSRGLSMQVLAGDFDGGGRDDDLVVHVVGPDGLPMPGARADLSGDVNLTDPDGIAAFHDLAKGTYDLNLTSDALPGHTYFATVVISAQQDAGSVFDFMFSGPDAVLALVAQIAIGFLGPIYVIALCFDTISRERLSGSIDYLLCRPMGRRAVVGGKFLGVLGALMVPIAGVSMAGVAIIAWRTGHSPSAGAVIGFLGYTVLLIGVFALLQIIFSTLARTTGTAVLSGIGLWLFFFLLFSIVVAVAGTVMDLDSGGYELFSTRASFLNPISLYSLSMGVAVGGTMAAGFPAWSPGLAMVVWLVICLAVAMEVFRRRATE